MQKDNQHTPKMHRLKRLHGVSSPDLTMNRSRAENTTNRTGKSRHRSTMAPSDFALPQNLSRRLATDRVSIFPTRAPLDGDNEHSDIELKLLYDEYLQKIMTEIILKKKTQEMEELFLSQLATITKEYESNVEKLFKLKTRERDIINLTRLQNDIDSQIMNVNKFTKSKDTEVLEYILSRLYSLLQHVDVLRCNNIVLPESPEEWKETNKALKSCNETLKSIMDLIGTKSESYQTVNNGIRDFLNIYKNIEECHKRTEIELCNLQALVLKTASLSLMQDSD